MAMALPGKMLVLVVVVILSRNRLVLVAEAMSNRC